MNQGLMRQIGNFVDLFQQSAAPGANIGDDPALIAVSLIRPLLGLVGIFFIVLMLWGGFTWMSSQGEEEKVQKAQKILIAATIGLVITLAAASIWAFISGKIIERLLPT